MGGILKKFMIKKIHQSKIDKHNLSLKKSGSTKKIKSNYKKMIVNKPWGYEYLVFENKFVAVWILFLKEGFSTSMHCHPKKKSSLIILSGRAIVSSLNALHELTELEAIMIDNGVFHSSEAISANGAIIMEIETPPDKSDLVRIKDKYGREEQGYEDSSHTTTNLKKYEYIDFHEGLKENKYIHKKLQKRHIRIQQHGKIEELTNYVKPHKKTIICFLDSPLFFGEKSVVGVGDIITQTELETLDIGKLEIAADFHTLIIH